MAIKTTPTNPTPKHSITYEPVRYKVAGVDISKTEHQVCVSSDLCEGNNRSFGAFTKDLRALVSWLKSLGIEGVAMEATGIYWYPLANMLQNEGFEILLVNPAEIKNVRGRKTDQNDAEWIMQLYMCGFLQGSFLPDNYGDAMKKVCRHKVQLVGARSQSILHMQKCLERMNIKLDNAISDITGKTGMTIIAAILNGERDPYVLANMADKRCKSSVEVIAASLEGIWDEELLFELKHHYDTYHFNDKMIKECDERLEKITEDYKSSCSNLEDEKNIVRANKGKNKKTGISWDVEESAFQIWGTNPKAIPGLSDTSCLYLLSELGANWIDRFPTVGHFVAWLNLVPNNEITGGKVKSSKMRKRKNPCGQVFRLAANSLLNNKGSMGDMFRRYRSKKGHLQAIVIMAHKLARQLFFMVKNRVQYDPETVSDAAVTAFANKRDYHLRMAAKYDKKLEESKAC